MKKKDSIIVGFSRPKAWYMPFSWLIRLVTWCSFSHTYLRYEDSYAKRNLIFEASGIKVNFLDQTKFDAAEDIYAEFNIPVSTKTKLGVIQYAMDNVGAPYAVGQIFGFPIVWLAALFGKKLKNPFFSGSNYFCSEIVTDILEEIKSVGDTMDASTATPKDVYDFLISKGYKPISGG